MPITDFSTLKSHINDTLDRTDLAPYNDTFVQLGEGYLRTEKRLMVREAEAETSLVPSNGVVTLPTDYGGFREAWAITNPVNELSLVEPKVLRREYPSAAASTPKVCAIVGSDMTVRPTTTANIGLIYYRKPSALSDANTSNWLLAAFPHVYLLACLVHSESFIRNDPRIGTWNTMLESALDRIKEVDELQRHGRTKSRVAGPTP